MTKPHLTPMVIVSWKGLPVTHWMIGDPLYGDGVLTGMIQATKKVIAEPVTA